MIDDLISRKAAIKETWREPRYADPLNVLTEMRDRLRNLPSAETFSYGHENDWIPVSERLPEETGEYLTTTMYGDVFCDHWQSCNFDRTEIVIAWMPLPKPYKAGEQE